MSQNYFLDKAIKPTPARVEEALGGRYQYWVELKKHLGNKATEEWKHYGKTLGWSCQLLYGKKNLLFMSARDGYFVVSFILGDKGVSIAQQSTLPGELIRQLVEARKYAEGRGIRVDIKSRRALEQVKTLAGIKAASWL